MWAMSPKPRRIRAHLRLRGRAGVRWASDSAAVVLAVGAWAASQPGPCLAELEILGKTADEVMAISRVCKVDWWACDLLRRTVQPACLL